MGQAPEAPLTAAGANQALQLAERLSSFPIDHVVCSPYARALATIRPFAKQTRLPVHIDERLAERTLSPEPIDNWLDAVQRSFLDLDFTIAGGESGRETLERGWAAIESVLQGGHRLPLVASHGQLLGLVLHSLDSTFGFAGWKAMQTPDIFLLERNRKQAFAFRRA
jgi:2,3-bisphosphoglycerate-dependent phosphoglycerate mutase